MTPPSPNRWIPASQPSIGEALVINIFGGPGSGKSTLASELFVLLKKKGVEVACPEEHAKLAIFSNQDWILDHQPVLLGRTWETLVALGNKVDCIIIDSPILLCSAYAGHAEPQSFHDLTFDLHSRTDRINIFLTRSDAIEYSTNGRRETATQARRVDTIIRTLLDRREEPCLDMVSGSGIPPVLVESILQHRESER